MREFKFRAWREETKYMRKNPFSEESGFHLEDGKLISMLGPEGYTYHDSDHYILMQYTGIKDKKGKEIYEGDLFRFGTMKQWKKGEGEVGVVEWQKKYANFGLFFYSIHGGEGQTGYDDSLPGVIEGLKIIGNIYENPELMGDKK